MIEVKTKMDKPPALPELLKSIRLARRRYDLPDKVLACGGFMEARPHKGIADYCFGIAMLPASWVEGYLRELQIRRYREAHPLCLTLQEAMERGEEPKWIECRYLKDRDHWTCDPVIAGSDGFHDRSLGTLSLKMKHYGKRWRAWPVRPSPEQSHDLPWEDEEEE